MNFRLSGLRCRSSDSPDVSGRLVACESGLPEGGGRQADLAGRGRDRSLDNGTASGSDIVKLSFRTLEDLHKGNLPQLLQEHLAAVQEISKS